jgi:5-methylcytosine-specific restriction endonuclease McrA
VHRAETAAHAKVYNAANKVRIAARQRAYYLLHRDEILAKDREHYIPSEGMPARICDRCGKNYQPTDGMQKYCVDCGHIEDEIKTAIRKADPERRVKEATRSKAYEAGSECKIKRRARDKIRYPARLADPKQIIYHAEYSAKHREEYPEKYKEYATNYRKRNPEKVCLYTSKHRAAIYANTPLDEMLTSTEWLAILTEHNGHCHYCSKKAKLTLDHVIPLSKGGKHSKDNVVPACAHCNSSKGSKTLEEWQAKRQREVASA